MAQLPVWPNYLYGPFYQMFSLIWNLMFTWVEFYEPKTHAYFKIKKGLSNKYRWKMKMYIV